MWTRRIDEAPATALFRICRIVSSVNWNSIKNYKSVCPGEVVSFPAMSSDFRR